MNRNLPFVLFGAGGHGKVVLDAALAANRKILFVVDDAPHELKLLGRPVIKSDAKRWTTLKQFRFVVSVGDNLTRARIFPQLTNRGGIPDNVIHPTSLISRFVSFGLGMWFSVWSRLIRGQLSATIASLTRPARLIMTA